jgi:hypothetical protein
MTHNSHHKVGVDVADHTRMAIVGGLVIAAICYLVAFLHHRHWWEFHLKRFAPRPDDHVRDWRDVMDKWWGTLWPITLGTGALLFGILHFFFD